MPDAEVVIDEPLIRHLLETQSPERAGLPLTFVAEGWDNALYRLGEQEVVRLPRRQLGADLVEREQHWLRRIEPNLPLPIPTPSFAGQPSERFPWRWSVCPWFDGAPASLVPFDDPAAAARTLGEFVAALHTDAPDDAPRNWYRSVPLADRDDATQSALRDLRDVLDAPVIGAAWEAAVATPTWDHAPCWLHGDLHPGNLLIDNGQLSAVIDFGDLCAGDPAADLGVAWMLFDRSARAAFREAVGVDDDTWARGRGWAITLGLAILRASADLPAYARFSRHALDEAVSSR